MKPITPQQIKIFHILLHKHGLCEEKAEILKELSGCRVTSTKDLYFEEIQPWINAMNRQVPEQEDTRQKMINSLLAMAREMGVVIRRNMIGAAGMEYKSDYSRLDAWMLESSYLKKPMKDYTYEEFPKLVSQYKAIYQSWLKR